MLKTLPFCFLLAICTHFSFGQTLVDTVTIGTGTANDYFGGPIYRSSSSSSFDYSRYSYLYTAAEMAAQGIPSGAIIKALPGIKRTTSRTKGEGFLKFFAKISPIPSLP